MALVCSEMDTAKLFERSLSGFWAEILPKFTLRLKELPRPPYARRDFDQLQLNFPELGGYLTEVGQNHDAPKAASATL